MNSENKFHRLYWLCSQSGKRYPAGVAFYNQGRGDYRLKVDTFCDGKSVFVKPISMTDGTINFRVETVVNTSKGPHRTEIGVGHASLETGYPIYMDIGPFERTLVLEAVA